MKGLDLNGRVGVGFYIYLKVKGHSFNFIVFGWCRNETVSTAY